MLRPYANAHIPPRASLRCVERCAHHHTLSGAAICAVRGGDCGALAFISVESDIGLFAFYSTNHRLTVGAGLSRGGSE